MSDPPVLQETIFHKLQSQFKARGQIRLPCIPALLEHYLDRIAALFDALDQTLDADGVTHIAQSLWLKLQEGFATSAHAKSILTYEPGEPPRPTFNFHVSIVAPSLAEDYQDWVKDKEPGAFGTHPDAKVMEVAAQLSDRPNSPILDVGAGTGRNTIPLAKLGYPVDSVELAPVFVEQLQVSAQAENLPVRVIAGDILTRQVKVRPAHYRLIIISEVISHFRDPSQLRQLLAKMCDGLRSGGLLLFNIFLPLEGYQPDRIAIEISQSVWCTLFSHSDLVAAMERLPLEQLSDQSAFDYEREHLPQSAWPPTSWYSTWAKGRNVFYLTNAQPPMELRWILCRRL